MRIRKNLFLGSLFHLYKGWSISYVSTWWHFKSGFPIGSIMPSREERKNHPGMPSRMSLTLDWPHRQGSFPLSFVSVQKLYTWGCVLQSTTADCPGASPESQSCHWFSRMPLWELVAYAGQPHHLRQYCGLVIFL